MAGQQELSGFRPPEDFDTGVNYESVIYELVKKKGCSYPAEIRRETGFSKDTVYFHLFQLVKKGFLAKHNLYGQKTAPSWIKPRLKEMWDMNIKGDRITGMAWYTLAEVKDDPKSSHYEMNKQYKKDINKIDGELNVHSGIEPTEEQKEALKEAEE